MSGLMETILWSGGAGQFLDTLASTYPTVIAYVMDTPRCSDPAYFLTNMFYASSIFHKTSLPMVLVYNKTDVKDPTFAKAWMRDFDSCQVAIRQQTQGEDGNRGLRNVTGCIGPALEEFNRRVEVCLYMTGTDLRSRMCLLARASALRNFSTSFREPYIYILQKLKDGLVKVSEEKLQNSIKQCGITSALRVCQEVCP